MLRGQAPSSAEQRSPEPRLLPLWTRGLRSLRKTEQACCLRFQGCAVGEGLAALRVGSYT